MRGERADAGEAVGKEIAKRGRGGYDANIGACRQPAERKKRRGATGGAPVAPGQLSYTEAKVMSEEAGRGWGPGRAAWLLAVAAVAALASLWAWWRPSNGPAPPAEANPDPRLAYKGPYRNIHPDVPYVGAAACRACHVEIAEAFARHPMGRSLSPIAKASATQPPPPASPFEALGRRMWLSQKGGETFHHIAAFDGEEKLYEQIMEAKYVVGSGTHTFSYLDERDGFVFETPITHYTRNGTWGLSPGFREELAHGRHITTPCLQCHADGLKVAPGFSDGKFAPGVFTHHAIGCERCHGPGGLHVSEREAGVPLEAPHDTATVNPARLAPPLRDAVCQQCHLQGALRVVSAGRDIMDFRPGLPLERFINVFVLPPDGEGAKLVSHAEEMQESGCFRGTEGRLGCISCHDPHSKPEPAGRVAFFRERCGRCHDGPGKKQCSLPTPARVKRVPNDSCVECHMPSREAKDVAHMALHDHRVPRRPPAPSRPIPPGASDGPMSLRSFFAARFPEGDPGMERDSGVAVAEAVGLGRREELAPRVAVGLRVALGRLEAAAARDARDVPAWLGRGVLHRALGDDAAAQRCFTHVLTREPNNAHALMGMGALLEARPQEALTYFRRLARAYPHQHTRRLGLAAVLLHTGDAAAAEAEARACVELAPGSTAYRFLLCRTLVAQGKSAEARKEMSVLRKLRPAKLGEYEEWFKRAVAGG